MNVETISRKAAESKETSPPLIDRNTLSDLYSLENFRALYWRLTQEISLRQFTLRQRRVLKFLLDSSYWIGQKAVELCDDDLTTGTNISRGNIAVILQFLADRNVVETLGSRVYTIGRKRLYTAYAVQPIARNWADSIGFALKDPEAIRALYTAIANSPKQTLMPEAPGLKEALTLALEETQNLPRHGLRITSPVVHPCAGLDGVLEGDTNRDSGSTKAATVDGGGIGRSSPVPSPSQQTNQIDPWRAMGDIWKTAVRAGVGLAPRVPDSGTPQPENTQPKDTNSSALVPDTGTTAALSSPEFVPGSGTTTAKTIDGAPLRRPDVYPPRVQPPTNPTAIVPDPGTNRAPSIRASARQTRNKTSLVLELKNKEQGLGGAPTVDQPWKNVESWKLRPADPWLVDQIKTILDTAKDINNRWAGCAGNWTNYIKRWPDDVLAMIGIYRESIAAGNHIHNPGGWMFKAARDLGKFRQPNPEKQTPTPRPKNAP